MEVIRKPNKLDFNGPINNFWTNQSRLVCIVKIFSHSFQYTVKPGFLTNFRSGPRFLDYLIPKRGDKALDTCWLIHDINYLGYLHSQTKADNLLYYMLQDAKIPEWKCQAIYIGLSIVGWFFYDKNGDKKYLEFNRTNIKNTNTLSVNKLKFNDFFEDKVRSEFKAFNETVRLESRQKGGLEGFDITAEEIDMNKVDSFFE